MQNRSQAGKWSLGVALACLAVGSAGCKDECVTTRDAFAHDVWAPFMATGCLKCHSPDGVAVVEENARFVLQPPSYPGFLDANLASVREMAKTDYEGRSLLLIKPLGEHGHGGGKVLDEDSDEYEALVELVEKLRAGEEETCGGQVKDLTPSNVALADPVQTLRRTTLHFAGRLPTAAEREVVATGGWAALDEVLGSMMKEPVFLDRLDELFNDVFLTDKYLPGREALNLLNGTEYPRAAQLRDAWNDIPAAQRVAYNEAVAREPLRLVRWVVEKDLPFTEILNADYTVVDDALAEIYAIEDGKTGLRTAKVKTATGVEIPHAGVLTTPAYLNRYPTTPTNRSRGRARVLLKTFLATDILKIADRPIDITQITAKDNPTLNHEACVVCHRIMDPIAGAFRGWDERDYELFRPDRTWHEDMLHPGFGKVDLPSDRYGSAIQWVAQQMAVDTRFDLAVVYIAWRAVSGRELLAYPLPTDPDFKARLSAWETQEAFMHQARKAFVDGGRRLRPLLRYFLTSEPFRAIRAPGASATSLVELESLGAARLASPEVLNRKIAATTGVRWRMTYDWANQRDWLGSNGFRLLYGGLDSDSVVERARTINGVMSNLATRMAAEVACLAVPYDLSKPQEERVLFPYVRLQEVPESAGHEVPGAIANARRNIVYLHDRLLGETLSVDDPEVDATLRLFVETWREGTSQGLTSSRLSWPCGVDPTTGQNLDDLIRRDPDYVARAWMATVAYLLSDYRFLYEL